MPTNQFDKEAFKYDMALDKTNDPAFPQWWLPQIIACRFLYMAAYCGKETIRLMQTEIEGYLRAKEGWA